MSGLSHLGRYHQQRWGIELDPCRDTENIKAEEGLAVRLVLPWRLEGPEKRGGPDWCLRGQGGKNGRRDA